MGLKYRSTFRLIIVAAVATFLILLSQISYAHKVHVPVHQYICKEAYNLLVNRGLPEALMAEMNQYIGNVDYYSLEPTLQLDPITHEMIYQDWQGTSICEGASDADQIITSIMPPSFGYALTPLCHFWDPYSDGIFIGLSIAGIPYLSAIYKAELFWQTARDNYPEDKETAYYWLGQVAHLLADMSVPAHVNCDSHLELSGIVEFEGTGDDSYEEYISNQQHYLNWDATEAGGAIDYKLLPLPTEYQDLSQDWQEDEVNLLKLFYNLAIEARKYDSDDIAGETDNGNVNKRSFDMNWEVNLDEVEVRVYIDLPTPSEQSAEESSYSISVRNGESRLIVSDDFGNQNLLPNDILPTHIRVIDGNNLEDFIIQEGADESERTDIADQDCEVIGSELMPEAMRYVAGLYQLFWDTCDTDKPTFHSLTIKDSNGNVIGNNGLVSGTVTVSVEVTDNIAIDTVELFVDGPYGELYPDAGDIYTRPWDTTESSPGFWTVLVKATDVSGNWNAVTQEVKVDNSIIVTANLSESIVDIGDPVTISGKVINALGEPIRGANVEARIGFSFAGSDGTDTNGDYSIQASAPMSGGSYTVKIEASYNGETGNAEETLLVSTPSNVDLAVSENFTVSPTSFIAPQKIRVSGVKVYNYGTDTSSGGTMWYRIKRASDGWVAASRSFPIDPIVPDNVLYWSGPVLDDPSFGVPSGASEGPYFVEVHIDYPNDNDQGNNRSSRSIFNGTPPEREAYRIVSPITGTEDASLTQPSHIAHTYYGDYVFYVYTVNYSGGWAKFIVHKNNVMITEYTLYAGDYEDYQWHFIIHVTSILSSTQVEFECFELTDPAQVPLEISPQHAYSAAGERLEYLITIPNADPPFTVLPMDDKAGASNWQWEQDPQGGNTWKWYTDLPSNQGPISGNSFWVVVPQYGAEDGYIKKIYVTVVANHDVSVSNLSPPNGSPPFNIGTEITISATVSAANNYTESPVIALLVSGPGGYSYTDTENPTFSGSRTVEFSPSWNTTSLQPGDYIITVTASISGDTNSANNSQSSTIHLNQPQLMLNVSSNSSTFLQGDTIEVYCAVTADGDPVTDANVIAQIFWPDSSQTKPVMNYDSIDSRYEYSFMATQQGTYFGSVEASKPGFSDGSQPILNMVVNNSPPDTSITNTYPFAGDWINSKNVFFNWIGSDTGTPVSQLQYAWKLDNGSWTSYSSDTEVFLPDLADGQHTFYVKAYDGSLEDASPASRSFFVDTTDPVVNITTNGGEDLITENVQITIQGTAQDPLPSSELNLVTINSGNINTGTLTNWSFTVDLNAGLNYLIITAVDKAGNPGFDTITIDCKPRISVTVTTSVGVGTTVVIDSQTENAPYAAEWRAGDQHTIGVESPQSGGPNKQYIFQNWSDGLAQTHDVSPVSDITYTANLLTQWKPTITLNGTDAEHTVSTEAHIQGGTQHIESGLQGVWNDWCDDGTELRFSQKTTGAIPREAVNARSWTIGTAISETINYAPPPIIASVSPDSGLIIGGTSVAIDGSNFGSIRGGGKVTFGGIEATTYNTWTDNHIECITPNHAEGAVDVVVVADNGLSGEKPAGFTYISLLRWKYDIGVGYEQFSSPAIDSKGTIHIGSGDHFLYSIYPDGSLNWKFETGGAINTTPSIDPNGNIYFGSLDGYLYALNSDGSLNWKYQTYGFYETFSCPAIDANGNIYYADGYLYNLNPDGSLKWQFSTYPYVIQASPAIGPDGIIYFGSRDYYFYALNPDKSIKWRYETGGGIVSSPALSSEGVIYFGSYDKYLYALDTTGTLKWKFETGNQIWSSPAIGADGTIYVASYDGFIYAVNPDGTQKWKFQVGKEVFSSPAVGNDNIIYFGSLNNYFYGISPNGTLRWSMETGNQIGASPVICEDGTIYFGSLDGYLYAVNSTSLGLAGSSWPKFHHDNQNTGAFPLNPPVLNSFTINNGDAKTTSQVVTLNNSATNDPTHYIASENADFNGSDWQPYSISPSFTLSTGYGTKTVYLKVKNSGGESNVLYDSIDFQPGIIYVANTGDDTTGDGTQDHPYKTIQKGIDEASDGDTVSVVDGTYTGMGNVNLDLKGKAITLKSENGPNNCIIDCQNAENTRGFYFHTNETPNSIVDGLTIQNGKSDHGGGIYCHLSSPKIINNRVINNLALGNGGGLYFSESSPVVEGNIIKDNTANYHGGGIFCIKSYPFIIDNITSNNTADSDGGGICCTGGSKPTLLNAKLTDNVAGHYGGGIYCISSSPILKNCIITDNSAGFYAGGIYSSYSSAPELMSSIITGNSDYLGTAIFCTKSSSVTITNTIMWNNGNKCVSFDPSGDPNAVTVSYSDLQGGQNGIANNNNGTVNWLDGNIDKDPMFTDTANGDYHLSDYSLCIGAGNDTPDVPPTDIEGNPRPNPAGSSPDMGAYENSRSTPLNSPPVAYDQSVTTNEDEPVNITLTGSDINDDPLTFHVVSNPAHGELTGTAPDLTYTPSPDYNSNDSFTFKVNDGKVDSNIATVSITVNPVNDAPTILSTIPDRSAQKNTQIVIDLTQYESDVEDTETALDWYVEGEEHCSVAGEYSDDDVLTFTPESDFIGDDYVTLYLKDSGGLTDSQQVKLTWIEIPPPVISSVAPEDGLTTGGTTVSIDGLNFGDAQGSGSVTFGGTAATSYTSWSDTSVVCVTPAHAAGTVDVVVTADNGLSGMKSSAFTYKEPQQAPIADADGTYTGVEGTAITFDGTGSYDPDGTIASYNWNFGDGKTGTGPKPSHPYADDGEYTVSLVVTDNDGLTSPPDTSTVTVRNEPPVVNAGPDQTVSVGDTVFLNGSFTDAGTLDTHTATIDWGDGTPVEPGVVTEVSGSGTVTGSHVYSDASGSPYTVTLTVTDDEGDSGQDAFDVNCVACADVSLTTGWNMISWPGEPNPSLVSDIVAGNPDVLPYFYTWDSGIGGYVTVSEVKCGDGYWVAATQDCLLEICYIPVYQLIRELAKGWNMAGSLACAVPVSSLTSSPSYHLPYVYTWDTSIGGYELVDDILPTVGHWVAATDNCDLTMSCSASPLVESYPSVDVTDPTWKSIVSVGSQELVFGMHPSATDGFDSILDKPLPPFPAAPSNDMKKQGNTKLNSTLKAAWLIADPTFPMLCDSYVNEDSQGVWELSVELPKPGKVEWSNLPEDYRCILYYGKRSVDMKGKGFLSLPAGNYSLRLVLDTFDSLPRKTEVLANYPNPFNPETWIPYKLAEDSNVLIEVYNATGQLVRTLNLGDKLAGAYVDRENAAYWDGKNEAGEYVSSGIYFYCLRVRDFTTTRKMVISK